MGMSQNGAKGMADTGKNYQEILTYFYKDVEIGNINDVVNRRNRDIILKLPERAKKETDDAKETEGITVWKR